MADTQITLGRLPVELVENMVGEQPPAAYVGNGCTSSPDFWRGKDLRPACHFHDWGYSKGGTERDRRRIDGELRRNLEACGASRWAAGIYYRRCRLWGSLLWRYDDPPPRMLLFVWCFVSRYFD